MNTRLKLFLDAEQLSPARFAEMMGIQASGVTHILQGRNRPGFDFFDKLIASFPTLNLEWLIAGKGRMYKDADGCSPLPSGGLNPPPTGAASEITKIMVFYADNHFWEFFPSKNG